MSSEGCGVMLPYYSASDNLEYKMEGYTVKLSGQVAWPTLKSDAENAVYLRVEQKREQSSRFLGYDVTSRNSHGHRSRSCGARALAVEEARPQS